MWPHYTFMRLGVIADIARPGDGNGGGDGSVAVLPDDYVSLYNWLCDGQR